MTERLTEEYFDDLEQFDRYAPKSPNIELYCGGDDFQRIIDKLAEYEIAEEEGRLVNLPCNVDDVLYCILPNDNFGERIIPCKVREIRMLPSIEIFLISIHETIGYLKWHHSRDIGKCIFHTKKDAEKALIKMNGGQDSAQ